MFGVDNIALIFVAGGAVVVITVIQFALAMRQDHEISMAGPREEEAAVTARTNEKRGEYAELEKRISEKSAKLDNISDTAAEHDALIRKRDGILLELSQMSERRAELNNLQDETDKLHNDHLAEEAKLAIAQTKLGEISERLSQADTLDHRISTLRDETVALEARRNELNADVKRLDEAEASLQGMIAQKEALHDEMRALARQVSDGRREANETEARTKILTEKLAGNLATLDDLRAETASSSQQRRDNEAKVISLEGQCAALSETVRERTARRDALEQEIIEISRSTSGSDNSTAVSADEALREVTKMPAVIALMQGLPDANFASERDALVGVRSAFASSGLRYHQRTLAAFHTAMKVNETTQMAVLAGISGTGKTQLPRQYAAGMGIGFLQVPVQPRWDSPQDLMGFYNYIERQFRPTDLCRALWALDSANRTEAVGHDNMLLVLLDEMNLARVEYYFSDFLSRLENRPRPERVENAVARKDAEIELEIPGLAHPPKIFPGYNVLFAGTMNEDESTQSLSDKVVDRANLIRFAAPLSFAPTDQNMPIPQNPRALSRSTWNQWQQRELDATSVNIVTESIGRMADIMREIGRPFGHRLAGAIQDYVRLYPDEEGQGDRVKIALADQIEMRLLPKLRGINIDEKSGAIEQLGALANDLGDDKLREAIDQSRDQSEATSQFAWLGVTR